MDPGTGASPGGGVTPPTVNLRRCKLVVLKGPQRGKEYVIASDVVRVGKAAGNDLLVTDETVSRVHFEIVRDAKGYLLRDMRSANGTFLDGAEIKEAYIRAGSIITAGASELKFTPFEERIELLPSEKEHLGEMVGRSTRMREIFALTEKVAATDATVLIQGEAGTGKDMIARALHELSRRSESPLIVVDCGAVAGTVIESELFGQEAGSGADAAATRQGAFELAAGGTVFLDEVGELSLELQPKLLRVVEQHELRRVGGSRTVKTDVRVIAATREDLRAEVEKGSIRQDLYVRLSAVPIVVPPLRERREDIPLLIDHFFADLKPAGEERADLSEADLAPLLAHDWPGNVRELRNLVERAVAFAVDPAHLLAELGSGAFSSTPGRQPGTPAFDPALSFRDNKERWNQQFERRYLQWLLRRAAGNISRAARDAGMDRKYLHKLIKKHSIDANKRRSPQ